MKQKKPIVLPLIPPSVRIQKEYERMMVDMIDEIRAEVIRDIVKPFKNDLAMDGITDWLSHVMDAVINRWSYNLDRIAPEMAKVFVGKSKSNYERRLLSILRRRGFTVGFNHSQYVEEQMQVALGENIGLIKSVGEQYLDRVRLSVWQSVKNGYDVEGLVKRLREIDGMSERRAKIIASDQVSKINQAIEEARATELGVTRAIWVHSSASKEPRPSHVKASGTEYELQKGLYLDGEWLKPAQAINCRCRPRLIIEL